MKIVLTALCAVFIAATVHAQDADQKPGLWESRITKMVVDGEDQMATMKALRQHMRDTVAKMPPAQRKQIEASLTPQDQDPMVQRVCLSAAMLKNLLTQGLPPGASQVDCTPGKIEHNGNRTTFETSCKRDGATVASKGVVVTAKDQIDTSAESIVTMENDKQARQTETQMKFISSDCGGLPPLDEVIKNMRAGATAPAKK